jgi:LPS-assembly protein
MMFQPNATFNFSSQFRFDQNDLSLQRTELQASAKFDRWSSSVLYGNYAAQPALGFLTEREGIQGRVNVKVTPTWQVFGGVLYDLQAQSVSTASIGAGYVDDCLIVAVNYVREYAFNSSSTYNEAVMFQVSLRTIGGNTVTQNLSSTSVGVPGFAMGVPGTTR